MEFRTWTVEKAALFSSLGRSWRLSSVQRGMLRARSDRPRPSSFSGRMGLAVVSMSGTDSAPRFRRSMQWARADQPMG